MEEDKEQLIKEEAIYQVAVISGINSCWCIRKAIKDLLFSCERKKSIDEMLETCEIKEYEIKPKDKHKKKGKEYKSWEHREFWRR